MLRADTGKRGKFLTVILASKVKHITVMVKRYFINCYASQNYYFQRFLREPGNRIGPD